MYVSIVIMWDGSGKRELFMFLYSLIKLNKT